MRLSRKITMNFIIDGPHDSLIISGSKPFTSLYIMKPMLLCTIIHDAKTWSSPNLYSVIIHLYLIIVLNVISLTITFFLQNIFIGQDDTLVHCFRILHNIIIR